ncbi:protein AF1q [Thamnophis elegans]|uniref:protein AF1q n=1 Tax=Thamnophis elegans TaxID=35005 RepID=UPI00137848A4|nr:protein AF1q [Thamnophis elegans]
MRDTVSSQYDSFLYWRMPIPELDLSELECLGMADLALFKPKRGYGSLLSEQKPAQKPSPGVPEEAETALLPFSSFNFWRPPIARISPVDFDLI